MASSPQKSASGITLRPPSVVNEPQPAAYTPASLAFLQGTWHVTHSTLPMWKSKRNVRITYDLLPPSSPSIPAERTDRLDDIVTYQALDSDKQHTVHGVDKASSATLDEWDWRGKGWLMIASSHWEVLGWGEEVGSAQDADKGQWAVTYFAKTLFTPAGIDVYSRRQRGLDPNTIRLIKEQFELMENAELKSLAQQMFEIKVDQATDTTS